jgi:hypothetical protein
MQKMLAKDDVEILDRFPDIGLGQFLVLRIRLKKKFKRRRGQVCDPFCRILLVPFLGLHDKFLHRRLIHKRYNQLKQNDNDEEHHEVPNLKMILLKTFEDFVGTYGHLGAGAI